VGAGYDRRKYIAPIGTVLESANGKQEENIWLAAYLNGQIDENSSFSTSVYGNRFESDFDLTEGTIGYGASAAYYRNITQNLSATAAVSIDGVNREDTTQVDDLSTAALLGMRYSF